jgi:hypothetical protein
VGPAYLGHPPSCCGHVGCCGEAAANTAATTSPAEATSAGPHARLGVLAAPTLSAAILSALENDLVATLPTRLPGGDWRVEVVQAPLLSLPATDSELVAAARELLLDHEWDLAVCLTDLPLHVARRPVVAHASPVHAVAIVSVPALGVLGLRHRVCDTVLELVDGLLGEPGSASTGRTGHLRRRRLARRVRELSDDDPATATFGFTSRVISGHLRLLVGMVRANQPWRLVTRLSRALVAATATGAFALVTSDIWRIANAAGALRLTVATAGSIVALTLTLILGADLWERAGSARVRGQVALFNIATVSTVLIGVAVLYIATFVLATCAAAVLVPRSLLDSAVGHDVHFTGLVTLGWLVSSVATIGGALGAGLESDEAVRNAAYSRRASAAPPAVGGDRGSTV